MEPGEPIQPQRTPDALPPSEAPRPKARNGAMNGAMEWIKVIVIALLISLPIRFFVAEPFIVNGASMDPTFSTGQFLIVDRLTFDFEAPQRGEVIVFKYPNDPSIYYIKRIIGLPNEKVDIAKGVVTISGGSNPQPITLNEPYIEAAHKSYDDFHIQLGPAQYFVMGDNRAQSSDSRVWGPLDKSLIVGRPILRLLPVNQVSLWPGEYKE